MNGTTISTYGTTGIEITQTSQNPVLVTASGTILTSGAYAIFDNTGSPGAISNYGVLQSTSAGGVGVEFASAGDLTNHGLVTAIADGVEVSGGTGTIHNYGSISASGMAGDGAWLRLGGTLTNGSASVTGLSITGGSDGVLMSFEGGTVQNYGTLAGAAGNGVEIDNGDGGTDLVANGSGTLSSFLISGGTNGVYLGGTGTVKNDGKIVGKNGDGVYIGGAGIVDNGSSDERGRSISGVSAGIEIFGGIGTISNYGSISASGTAGDGAWLRLGGTLTNGSAAVTGLSITGGSDGVLMSFEGGTVQNYGTLAGAAGNGVEIDNGDGGTDLVANGSGTLSSFLISGGANGVYLGGTGTLKNDGKIVGKSGDGVYIGGAGIVDNGSSGERGRSISGVSAGIEISGGTGTISNYGSISASGTAGDGAWLRLGGTLTNGSTSVTGLSITGGSDGVLMSFEGGTVQNYGTLAGAAGNGVEIDNGDGGTDLVENGSGTLSSFLISGGTNGVYLGGTGTLKNDGKIVGKNGDGVYIGGAGIVDNGSSGERGRSIIGVSAGIEISGGTGTISNYGSISASGTAGDGAWLRLGGTLTNGSTSVTGLSITGGSDGVLMSFEGGTVQNYGTLAGTAGNGVEIDNGDGGTDLVENGSGTLSSFLISGGANGVVLGGSGTVKNDGTIVGKDGNGVYIGGAGIIDNGSSDELGRLISGVSAGIEFSGGVGKVSNFGSISASGTAGDGAWLRLGGTLTNGSASVTGLSITGGSDGVLMSFEGGTVQNYGTLAGTAGNGVEIDNGDGGTDLVENGSGTLSSFLISGGANGVVLGGSGTVKNDGTIVGKDGDGVYIGGAGIIDNGSSDELGRLISGVSAGIEFSGGVGKVSNFGSISASGTAGDGVWLRLGGTLTNGSASVNGAAITGGGNGVLMSYNGGTVQNYGTLAGSTGNGVEIDNGDGGTDLVKNGKDATISGEIGVLVRGAGEVINAGTITGAGGVAVQFGGNDTLVVDAGAVFNGLVEGGNGVNTLDLGSGTSGLINSEFVGFADYGVGIGASWSLDGSTSIQVVLDDGSISLSASATLSITGSISAESSGVFQLGLGATLNVAADLGTQSKMSFLGNANLVIENASSFGTQSGTSTYGGPLLENFVAGDVIDLQSISAAGDTIDFSASTGLLQVMNGSTALATLAFQDSTLGAGTFHVGGDSAGHAMITLG
jgi:hypothetical protein